MSTKADAAVRNVSPVASVSVASPGAVEALLRTDRDHGQTLLRIALGLIIFPHGAQHFLGWFGGYGLQATLAWMSNDIGIPLPLAAAAITAEFFAPIALILGIGGRLAALAIAGVMVGAAATHFEHGFFMNWYGAMPGGAEGFEYHLLAIAMASAIVLKGSGAVSVDRVLIGSRRAWG